MFALGSREFRRWIESRPSVVLVLAWAMLALALSASSPVGALAQGRIRTSEAQLLREAAARESGGDFSGAEEVLLQLLQASISSQLLACSFHGRQN